MFGVFARFLGRFTRRSDTQLGQLQDLIALNEGGAPCSGRLACCRGPPECQLEFRTNFDMGTYCCSFAYEGHDQVLIAFGDEIEALYGDHADVELPQALIAFGSGTQVQKDDQTEVGLLPDN